MRAVTRYRPGAKSFPTRMTTRSCSGRTDTPRIGSPPTNSCTEATRDTRRVTREPRRTQLGGRKRAISPAAPAEGTSGPGGATSGSTGRSRQVRIVEIVLLSPSMGGGPLTSAVFVTVRISHASPGAWVLREQV